ncbi:MAG: terpene cyclase/mutase family protein [Planctomycetes bacterium]|nr:terpene cyclase/mutase family protein [Planctomycetota bacterium]
MRYLRIVFAFIALGLILTNASFVYPADKGSGADKELQKKIDEAIAKGTGYLLTSPLPPNTRELILLTLIHGEVSPFNDIFKGLLNNMLESPLDRTYNVALQAMALEKLDAKKYQERIAECAQWLVDAQCKNGQWSYVGNNQLAAQTTPRNKPQVTPSTTQKDEYITGNGIKADIIIKRKTIVGVPSGDNSNTQYAVLGLRACMDAGIALPKDTITLTKKWWESAQNPDGGWNYGSLRTQASYASMTAGGISSLAILEYYMKEKYKDCQRIKRAVRWMENSFTTTLDLRVGWALYTYYSFERAGILAEVDKFGRYDWYLEGAKRLVNSQNASGSWSGASGDVVNACFAVLFLKRATKALRAEITPVKKMKPMETPVEPKNDKPEDFVQNSPAAQPNARAVENIPAVEENPLTENVQPFVQTRNYIIITLKNNSVVKGSYLNYHKGDFLLVTDDGIKTIEIGNLFSIEYREVK